MKSILKTFTFWCILFSIFGIFMHQIGQDSKSIILIGCNPILNAFGNHDSLRTMLDSGLMISCRTIQGSISIYWYIASILSFVLYGVLLDSLRFLWKIYRT